MIRNPIVYSPINWDCPTQCGNRLMLLLVYINLSVLLLILGTKYNEHYTYQFGESEL